MPRRPLPILFSLILVPVTAGAEPLPPGALHRFGPFRGTPVVAFAPSGKSIAIADASGRVDLYDVASRKLLKTLRENGPAVLVIGFAPDGAAVTIAPTGESVRRFDPSTGNELRPIGHGPAAGFAYSPDGKRVAVLEPDGGVRLFDAGEPKELWRVQVVGEVNSVAVTPDGKTVVAAVSQRLRASGPPLLLLDAEKGKPRDDIKFTGRSDNTALLTFAASPDRRHLVTVHADHFLRIWDLNAGWIARSLTTPRLGVGVPSVAYSADGKWLAAVGDGALRVWEMATGDEVLSREDPELMLKAVVFSPDMGVIATASPGTVTLWSSRPQPFPIVHTTPVEMCFPDLAGGEAIWAYRAVHVLASRPTEAVPLIRAMLPPRANAAVARHITELADANFRVRELATRELESAGRSAVPAFVAALADEKSPEAQRRLKKMIERFGATAPWDVILGRSIQVLELCATPEAIALLREYADGTNLADAAKAALARIAVRK